MKRAYMFLCALPLLAACSKDAEFDEFTTFNDNLVKEGSEKADKEGTDAAEKAFNDKKDELKKKYDSFKNARGAQVKPETKTKFEKSLKDGMTGMCTLQLKDMFDKEKSAKY